MTHPKNSESIMEERRRSSDSSSASDDEIDQELTALIQAKVRRRVNKKRSNSFQWEDLHF